MQSKHQADYWYNQTERDTMEFQEQTMLLINGLQPNNYIKMGEGLVDIN